MQTISKTELARRGHRAFKIVDREDRLAVTDYGQVEYIIMTADAYADLCDASDPELAAAAQEARDAKRGDLVPIEEKIASYGA